MNRQAGNNKSTDVKHQAAVLAYRIMRDRIKVLLITSRDTGRWILPKGNIGEGFTPLSAAMLEAFEEAGIRGNAHGTLPFGFYTYLKRLADGSEIPASVEVFLVQATKITKKFPERNCRSRSWTSIKKAVKMVQEPGIVTLLERLSEIEANLVLGCISS